LGGGAFASVRLVPRPFAFARVAFDGLDPAARAFSARKAAVRTTLASVILVSWIAAAGLVWFTVDLAASMPGRDGLGRVGDMARATTLFDRRDQPVFTLFKEQRIEVQLSQVAPIARQAILAIEDQRFYEHRGVDTIRIVGSAVANLREGRRAQGGSTLTQQLARQSFLTRDKTLRRKLKEVVLAAELESTYSKDEILELYLNKVYFGDGLHGIEAAARGYFGTHAADLTLGQASLLAGLVKSPSAYAPTVNLERAINRRAVVLQAMVDAEVITPAAAAAAKAEPVVLKDGLNRDEEHGGYFKEEVRRILVGKFGTGRVYEGGLRVYTTIDPAMQTAAESAVASSIAEIEKRRAARHMNTDASDGKNPLQAALLAMDPETGEVRALVGGRSFGASRFDRATQAHRQPGSAFKPFVYATALEEGWAPASIVDHLDEPIATLQGDWMPEDEHLDTPELTLRSALRTSSNRAAARLLQEVGIPKTVAVAKQLGVASVPSVPSLALGSGEVTLLELTGAYATFAADGIYHTPRLIRRVEDADGKVIYDADETGARVVSEQTAFLLTSMLSDVVNAGTAWKARQLGFTLPAAGKTGTTNDYVDAWFAGYTPHLVAGVWLGFDQPQTILPGGYAGDLAVPMWAKFMKAATNGDKPETFALPKGLVAVQVCRLSGKLPASGCSDVAVVNDAGETSRRSMVYTDYFVRGQEPTEICPLHGGGSLLNKFASIFGHHEPPVTSAVIAGPKPAVAEPPLPASTASAPATGDATDKPAKKRGFWGRLFHGKDKPKSTPASSDPNPQP
jgi:penicillin-binding protein 1A